MSVSIRQATIDDLDPLAGLFDSYRVFYGQPSDVERARSFLRDRLEATESVIFVAEAGERMLGFTQLYPSFSSVRTVRTFILNDLFVEEAGRGKGTAAALLRAARLFAKGRGPGGLTLSTARDNVNAQRLYERDGWTRDDTFMVYHRAV